MAIAGFPDRFFYPLSPFEFWGKMNVLKAGIQFADRLTTVSERYAEEIQSSEEFGFGLQGVLNARHADISAGHTAQRLHAVVLSIAPVFRSSLLI